jgi:hypothetical protein
MELSEHLSLVRVDPISSLRIEVGGGTCDPQIDPRRVDPTVAGDVRMFAASTSKDSSGRTDEMQGRLVCCLSPEYAGLGCGDSAGGNWSI